MNTNQIVKLNHIKVIKVDHELVIPLNIPATLYPETARIDYYEPQDPAPETSLMKKIRKLFSFSQSSDKDEEPLPDLSGE